MTDPSCPSIVAAFEHDVFYRAICPDHLHGAADRRAILEQYFAYSIQEGNAIGRSVHLSDPTRGVAVWLLPQNLKVRMRAARDKRLFLERTLHPEGCAAYYRIVEFMGAKAATVVDEEAWYLSILAVAPAAQGQGLGRKLLQPTLEEADRASATCYVETFTPRNVAFYERVGFVTRAQFSEPTTGADYTVMIRPPRIF